jgi:hypothetical protein
MSPEKAVVAGDVRANENVVLKAIHTALRTGAHRIVGRARSGLRRGQVPTRSSRRRAEVEYICNSSAMRLAFDSTYRGYDPA